MGSSAQNSSGGQIEYEMMLPNQAPRFSTPHFFSFFFFPTRPILVPTKANLKTLKKINIRRQNHHLEIEYQMMLPTKPKVSNEVHLSRLVCKNRFDANQCARAQSDDAYRGCVSWTYTRKNVSKDRPFIFDIERSSYRRKTRHVVNGCLPRLAYNEITCCWPAMHLWHLACCFLSTWSLAYVCIQRYRVVVTADFVPHLLCFLFWNGGTPKSTI